MLTRRAVIAAVIAGPPALLLRPARDAQITGVEISFEDFQYRTLYKFGGTEVDRVTLLNVHCTVRGRDGRTATGFGSMTMGNVWSYPSRTLSYDQTLDAMKNLSARIAKVTRNYNEWGHPIEANVALELEYANAAGSIPPLCTLVTASPFDAAIHDAYGKLHGRNSFLTLGREFLRGDLSRFLGADFRGETLDRYVLPRAKPSLPLYHSIGASDPIVAADIQQPLNDGLPETLAAWIKYDGVTHLKIKLNGDDPVWDLQRVINIHEAASPVAECVYSLDFNERCPNVAYLLEFMRDLKRRAPVAFARIQYIEQPTARDLRLHPNDKVHAASQQVPVVIDESLTGIDAFLLALEMGYSGAALKACKGQTQALLIAALAQKRKVFLCVQDLTCPGASLVHSVSLAAHVPGVAAIEANSRQYVPAANVGWEKRFPGIFVIKDGLVRTAGIDGPGLGVVPA